MTLNSHQLNPSTNLIPFTYGSNPVRVVSREDGPWFVLADVCAVLELEKPSRVSVRLDDDEKDAHTVSTPGGAQRATIVNESGLWSLVLTSRKPEAKRFKKWLTSEVIPSIRKTGGYSTASSFPQSLSEPVGTNELLKLLTEQSELLRALGEHLRRPTTDDRPVSAPQAPSAAIKPFKDVAPSHSEDGLWKSAKDVAQSVGLLGLKAPRAERMKAAVAVGKELSAICRLLGLSTKLKATGHYPVTLYPEAAISVFSRAKPLTLTTR